MDDLEAALAQIPGQYFYILAKGRNRLEEPLYAAVIYPGTISIDERREPVAGAESEDSLAEAVRQAVAKLPA